MAGDSGTPVSSLHTASRSSWACTWVRVRVRVTRRVRVRLLGLHLTGRIGQGQDNEHSTLKWGDRRLIGDCCSTQGDEEGGLILVMVLEWNSKGEEVNGTAGSSQQSG